MSEPRTAAGRKHLEWLLAGDDVFPDDALAAVLAIEAEAQELALRRVREVVEGLDYRMVEWWALNGETYSLVQVVNWSAVLAVIAGGAGGSEP